jgi:hypothetical protein
MTVLGVSLMTDPVKVEIVGPEMTNTNDPWRTQGYYHEEQQEARERHAMLQEQHRLITRSVRWQQGQVLR